MEKEISVELIVPNENNCRKKFNLKKLEQMAETIKRNSLFNPITVTPLDNGKYKIITGERRWRAHKISGLKTIKCNVRENVSKRQMLIENYIENEHREELDPWDRAAGLEALLVDITGDKHPMHILEEMDFKDKREWSKEEKHIAEEIKKLGISLNECVMTMGVIELPEDMQKELCDWSFSYARELARIEDNDIKHTIWKGIRKNKKSISDVKRMVDGYMNAGGPAKNLMVRISEYEIPDSQAIANLSESLLKRLNNFSVNGLTLTEKIMLKSDLGEVKKSCEKILKSLE